VTESPDRPAFPVLGSEPIYDGKLVSLRRDTVRMADGAQVQREIVAHPGAVGIVALDDDGQVVLVNQYRPALRDWLDELPAGLLDVDSETALDAARRELAEEAGVQAERWNVLVDLHPSPGMSNEAIRVYLARELTAAAGHDAFEPADEEAVMTVSRVPLDEAVRRVLSGEITNAAAVAGLLAAARGSAEGWTALRPATAPWAARPGREA
jgi:8-oxo-dGTP pyrophosphatase MutT (NUDIX family)